MVSMRVRHMAEHTHTHRHKHTQAAPVFQLAQASERSAAWRNPVLTGAHVRWRALCAQAQRSL